MILSRGRAAWWTATKLPLSRRSTTKHAASSIAIRQNSHSSADDCNDYVIGYGSILCQTSRSVTCPELRHTPALPIVVHGVQRCWSKHSTRPYTAMGVVPTTTASGSGTTGVLLPVTATQLSLLDKREAGYHRVPISWEDIHKVPFLDDEYYKTNAPSSSTDLTDGALRILDHLLYSSSNNNKNHPHNIWIYQPNQPQRPTHDKPMAQSYLDTILRGCLDISTEFAVDFLATTGGWSNHHNNDGVHWVDDRAEPRYLRADSDWISQHADAIDDLLQQHRAKEFGFRYQDKDNNAYIGG